MLNLLSLEQRRFLFDVLFLYKALNDYTNISIYICRFFSDSDRYPLRGKDECTLKKNYAIVVIPLSFVFSVGSWTCGTPLLVRQATTIASFKKEVRGF